MSLDQFAFDPEGVVYTFNLAVIVSLVAAGGLAAAWGFRRRSAPLRHGILVATLGLTLLCPVAVWVGQQNGLGLAHLRLAGPQGDENFQEGRSAQSAREIAPAAPLVSGEPAAAALPAWQPETSLSYDPVAASPSQPVWRPAPPARTAPAWGEAGPSPPVAEGPRGPAWWQVVGTLAAYAWTLGAMIGAARLGCGCTAVTRLCRSSKPSCDPRLARLALRAAETAGLGRAPQVLVAPCVPVPVSVGLVRPAIILPDDLARELDDDRLQAVLLHEAAHVARHDLWIGLFQRIALVFFWWNPLVRRACGQISELREDICDNYVVRLQGGGAGLAQVLIDLAGRVTLRPHLPSAVAVLEPKLTGLSGRIVRLISKERNMATRMTPVSTLLVMGCGAAALLGIAVIGGLRVAHARQPALSEVDAEDQGQLSTQGPMAQTASQAATALDTAESAAASATRAAPGGSADRFEYRGRVLAPNGKPLPGADIYLIYATLPPLKVRAVSDAQGTFRFSATKSEFDTSRSETPWLFSTVVAVPPRSDPQGLGIAWEKAAVFETSGRMLETLLREHPDVAAGLKEKPEPVLRLVKDVPLAGRIVSKGQPVAGAKITVLDISTSKNEDLAGWLQAVENEKADFYRARDKLTRSLSTEPALHPIVPPATSDGQGKFRLTGIGRERIVELLIEGPGIESRKVNARTRPGPTLEVPEQSEHPSLGTMTYHGAEFEHVARPSVPIVGAVRDKDTGKPLAGVTIQSNKLAGHLVHGFPMDFIRAVSDAEGRYRLTGMPVNVPRKKAARPELEDLDDNGIVAVPPLEQPYLLSVKEVALAEGKEPVRVDFQLKRGLWIRGRVTDAKTGQPLRGYVQYYVFVSNPNSKKAPGFRGTDARHRHRTDADGRCAVPGLPGRGLVGVMLHEHERYPRGAGAEKIRGDRDAGGSKVFETEPLCATPFNMHAWAEVNPPEGAESAVQDFRLDPEQTLTGIVLDPEGRPLTGADYSGLMAFPTWRPLGTEKFAINSYRPDEPRMLLFVHKQRKLAGSQIVQGPQPKPIIVRLQPSGAITGRVVDAEGNPKAGIQLYGSAGVKQQGSYPGSTPEQYYQTDQAGRFRIEGLAPGVKYGLTAISDQRYLGEVLSDATVQPGQTKDLGALAIKRPRLSDLIGKKPKPASRPGPKIRPTGNLVFINLQPKANHELKRSVNEEGEDNSLRLLPQGRQTLDGVGFQIGPQYVRLQGTQRPKLPRQVTGIPVNVTVDRLYILHGTEYGASNSEEDPNVLKDGTPIGHYTVHCADGSTATIPIVYGEDVRDWWNWDESTRLTKRGEIVWTGENEAASEYGVSLRLYLTVWENPKPGTKIQGIDYVSQFNTAATPFCVAITAEQAPGR